MRRSLFVSSFIAIALAVGSYVPAHTQTRRDDPPPAQRGKDDQVKIGTYEVRLPITVMNKNEFVTGLGKHNFEVYEDGKQQRIENFIAPSELPLNIAVLMDTSESVKLKLPFEKDAAEDFIATVTTYRRRDKVLFATFDSKVELHQDFTDAQEPLVRAIKKVKAGGYTRMYDAVHRIIEEKMANVLDKEARQIIVILSDGADTASERSLKEAIELAQRHDVTIFGISTKNFKGIMAGTVETSDDKELRRLCESTGGQLYLPSQKRELFESFSRLSKGLRLEYVIYYRPVNQEQTGKRREIKVKLVRGVNGKLFHKQGYFY